MEVFSKKMSSKFFFSLSPKEENKKGLRKFSARFLSFSNKILMIQKIALSSNRGQGNFRGLVASRSKRPKTTNSVLEDSTSVSRLTCTDSDRFNSLYVPVAQYYACIPGYSLTVK